MPAFADEIREAEQEGVRIILLAAPTRVLVDEHGHIKGIECQTMKLGDFDNKGRRVPVPVPGSEFTLDVDTVIPAIGEFADVRDLFRDHAVKTQRDGTIEIDDEGRTNIPGIFGGGDVTFGASTVIKAIAAGERGAVAIDRYLTGDCTRVYPWRVRSRSPAPFKVGAEPVAYPMSRPALLPVAERSRSFVEVQESISPEVAIKEAQRCLRCDYREEEV
jgi:NADPH-dependent glutamate synthase beta subunit-like oxidoreductase